MNDRRFLITVVGFGGIVIVLLTIYLGVMISSRKAADICPIVSRIEGKFESATNRKDVYDFEVARTVIITAKEVLNEKSHKITRQQYETLISNAKNIANKINENEKLHKQRTKEGLVYYEGKWIKEEDRSRLIKEQEKKEEQRISEQIARDELRRLKEQRNIRIQKIVRNVVIALFLAGIALIIMLIPYFIAKRKNHPQRQAIFVACIISPFAFWLPWFVALVWAFTSTKPTKVFVCNPSIAVNVPQTTDTKKCPYCAELIKKEAKICRFCKHS